MQHGCSWLFRVTFGRTHRLPTTVLPTTTYLPLPIHLLPIYYLVSTRVLVHVCMYVYVDARVYKHVPMCMSRCVYVYVYVYVYMYVCTCL